MSFLILPDTCDIGEISDGYHTFNGLYHQRAILFAALVNQNPDISWKSWKHEDGKYCFDSYCEWFIVGIDTPEGSYTYHYKAEYFDIFKCQELPVAKRWDGHNEEDVTRLLSLSRDDECKGIRIECDICRSPLTKGNSFTFSIASNDETDSDSCMTRYICSNCASKMRKAYIDILKKGA